MTAETAKVSADIQRIVIERRDPDGNYLGSYVYENGELKEVRDGND